MAYETGAGATRTVFGHRCHRLYQNAPSGSTYFQSDIYGSPLFATDGQGAVKRYAERGIWGTLKPGTDILPELEENMRFTTYRYDPVLGKHFALARFYDGANGRMMSKDPVKRGMNPYCYCDNDPVNYEDSTGEIMHILGASFLGGLLGAGGAALDSIVSQALDGGKIDWKEVGGSAIDGGIIGAAQAGLLASGAGVPAALLVDFLAGMAGSAAEQYYVDGKIDAGESFTRGLTNAAGNALYGTDKLKGAWDAFRRGGKTGAAEAGIRYIFDHIGSNPAQVRMGTGLLPAIAGNFTPGDLLRDPKRGCGSESPFTPKLGYHSARGYQYDVPRISESRSNKASLGGFLKETALGGLMGGLTSAAFYKVGKGIDKLKESLRGRKSASEYDLYRKNTNIGVYKDLEEVMQLKNVKNVANKAGIDLNGVKVKIDKNPELIGRDIYGYTDGKTITLYPDAFINTENLVKTLGHERVHVYQVEIFGKPTSTDVLKEFEKVATMSEQMWWDYFKLKNGGQ